MSVSVQFQGPVIVEVDKLAALLALAGTPATVELLGEGKVPAKRGPKPKETNGEATNGSAPVQVESAPARADVAPEVEQPKKKRGRRTKAEMEAARQAAGTANGSAPAETTSAPAETTTAPAVNDAALLNRFTGLVDKDYDNALKLLEGFGVSRFTDLKAEQLGEFGKALHSLGA